MHSAATPPGVRLAQAVSPARGKLWLAETQLLALVPVGVELRPSKPWNLRSRSSCASSGATCSSGILAEYVDSLFQSHMYMCMYA